MTAHRTSARGTLFLTLAALFYLGLLATAAEAAPSAKVPKLVFPVVGQSTFGNDFTSPRASGQHGATDIMAPRGLPIVAVEAGKVSFWTRSASAGCMLYLYGESGLTYLYIHLNDTRADGSRSGCAGGVAFAAGLRDGAAVEKGQLVGYVGDSGNAAGNPQLHFEILDGKQPLNPYRPLLAARPLLFAAARGTTFTAALTGKVVTAAGEELQVSVEQVRWWPGGRRSKQPGQKLSVSVPETASVEGVATAPGGVAYPTIDLLLSGSTVTVWTEPAKVTLAAQAGDKGTLSAARVVLKRAS